MFRRRSELEKFLAVAEAGKIVTAADRLAIGQPALTRAIAALESRFGAPLFECLPTGVRPTALGVVAAEQARRLLRAYEEAEDRIGDRFLTATSPADGYDLASWSRRSATLPAAPVRSPRARSSAAGPPSPVRSNSPSLSAAAPAGRGNTPRSAAHCGAAASAPRSSTARPRSGSRWRSPRECGAADRGCGLRCGGTALLPSRAPSPAAACAWRGPSPGSPAASPRSSRASRAPPHRARA